jgi:3-hydroxy-9,10-secoandrosta-1,3,5(10)-triene-9,17-dione monooxygenase
MSKPIRPEIAAIIERIDDLRPQLVDAGREGEELRRLQPAALDALAATGAFSISVPTRFGGLAANTCEANAVARVIGRGDGSAAWVQGILDSGAWVVSLMDNRAQADVWREDKNLRAFISIVLATTSDAQRVEGG